MIRYTSEVHARNAGAEEVTGYQRVRSPDDFRLHGSRTLAIAIAYDTRGFRVSRADRAIFALPVILVHAQVELDSHFGDP